MFKNIENMSLNEMAIYTINLMFLLEKSVELHNDLILTEFSKYFLKLKKSKKYCLFFDTLVICSGDLNMKWVYLFCKKNKSIYDDLAEDFLKKYDDYELYTKHNYFEYNNTTYFYNLGSKLYTDKNFLDFIEDYKNTEYDENKIILNIKNLMTTIRKNNLLQDF